MRSSRSRSSSSDPALATGGDPAVADLVESELAAASDREWLRRHVLELSAVREREWETAEQEAQRCREQTLRQSPRK